jgi:hypothetical protein
VPRFEKGAGRSPAPFPEAVRHRRNQQQVLFTRRPGRLSETSSKDFRQIPNVFSNKKKHPVKHPAKEGSDNFQATAHPVFNSTIQIENLKFKIKFSFSPIFK